MAHIEYRNRLRFTHGLYSFYIFLTFNISWKFCAITLMLCGLYSRYVCSWERINNVGSVNRFAHYRCNKIHRANLYATNNYIIDFSWLIMVVFVLSLLCVWDSEKMWSWGRTKEGTFGRLIPSLLARQKRNRKSRDVRKLEHLPDRPEGRPGRSYSSVRDRKCYIPIWVINQGKALAQENEKRRKTMNRLEQWR